MNDQSTIHLGACLVSVQIYYGDVDTNLWIVAFLWTFSSSHYQQEEGADVTFIRLLGANIWLKVVNLKNWKI